MACALITWNDAALAFAFALNLAFAVYGFIVILSARRTQQKQAVLAAELNPLHAQLHAARDMFLALCVQSVMAGQWPHRQVLAVLHAKALANAAYLGEWLELKEKEQGQDG